MSDHASNDDMMAAHRATYAGFVRGGIIIAVACFFILVGLCNFAFAHTMGLFMGFAGIIAGLIALAIDARSGSRSFGLSLILLLAYALITAINVS